MNLKPASSVRLQRFRSYCVQKSLPPSVFFLKKKTPRTGAENRYSNCGTAIEAIAIALFVVVFPSAAQRAPVNPQGPAPEASAAGLERHLDDLTAKLDQMRQELIASQIEMQELRAELRSLKAQLGEREQSQEATEAVAALKSSIQQLQEQSEVVQAQIKQHDQTKVESALKYPVRISGTLLFTSILQSGKSDNADAPTVALPKVPNTPSGSLSATARQTVVGIDASGPHLWGARAFADLNVDFFDGISYADYWTSAGGVRLRTAHARMEWPDRSLLLTLDRPLISPLQSTSWISVGEPALAWSGNLWTWSPQIEFKENSIIPHRATSFEFGLIDPPAPGIPPSNGVRIPGASERSRQPGFEARLSHEFPLNDRAVTLGASGYYSRQAYSNDRHVDAWAATTDWNMSFARFLDFSGEFYRGRAIGGLGGGTFKDYITYDSYTSLRGLDALGGWGQFKIVFSPTIEANLAAGQDNAYASELRNSDFATEPDYYDNLARNQTFFGNLIYKPRSFLLLSAEFREIRSWPINGSANLDRILGMAAGYSF